MDGAKMIRGGMDSQMLVKWREEEGRRLEGRREHEEE